MFNHNGSAGPRYRPNRRALVLPALAGVATAVYVMLSDFQGRSQDEAMLALLPWVAGLVGGNMLLMAGHLFTLPTWTRRIFYPIFIAAVTLVFYGLITIVACYALAIALLLFLVPILFGAVFSSKGGSSGSSSSYREEAYVNDGSLFGRTLTRQSGDIDWHDNCGGTYEESCGVFRRKY